ncbi:MAG: transglutaminase domain-containing protein [Fusicatenibacter sp.]|nr:transglutaminase domain-containing protein [Lachnospiraceae bacterium]MDY2937259.1 transglutaminase domain-containing protein [Fusicatenibacter sp.]
MITTMNINENFRYLNAGMPEDIVRRKLSGDADGAVRLIDQWLSKENLVPEMRYSLTAEREMILRQMDDFPYTKEQALSRIRSCIPDFTEEEFDSRVDAGQIRWCYQNGEMRYFARFLESMCKAVPEITRRAQMALPGNESAVKGSRGDDRISCCIQKMKENGSMSVRTRIRASLRLNDDQFYPGVNIRAHLPIPAECEQQSEIVIEQMDPPTGVISPGDAKARTVCWEECMEENHEFTVVYSYVHTARYHEPGKTQECEIPTEEFTKEEQPHIVFTPYLKSLTEEVLQGETDPLEKAHRIYDFITLNMKYTYMPEYFCLENIAENCARSYTGDCGVFALLFITMCRCAGIPACWQSGLAAEPDFCGAHDWARFFVESRGWLYADPSYGVSAVRLGDEERRRFYFGNLDPYRMVANNAFQAPFTIEKQYWRADPYDNQVGEMETGERGLKYSEYQTTKEVLLCEEL